MSFYLFNDKPFSGSHVTFGVKRGVCEKTNLHYCILQTYVVLDESIKLVQVTKNYYFPHRSRKEWANCESCQKSGYFGEKLPKTEVLYEE